MRKGGMLCLLSRGKGPWARLYFRPPVTAKIMEGGFRCVLIIPERIPSGYLFYPFILGTRWSRQEESPEEGWQKFRIDQYGLTIVSVSPAILGMPLEIFRGILSLPLSLRTGIVLWPSSSEMRLLFGVKEDFFSPQKIERRQKEKEELLGPCSVRFSKKVGVYWVAFLSETARMMGDLRGLICRETTDRSLLFEPLGECPFFCASCPRFDCYPFHGGGRGRTERRICITDLVSLLTGLPLLALKQPLRGEVWRTKGNFIRVEFPATKPPTRGR